MKDNENKEIKIKDTPIIPLGGNIKVNTFINNNITDNQTQDNDVNNQESTPVQNNIEQDINIFNNQEIPPVPVSTIKPVEAEENSVDNIDLSTDNSEQNTDIFNNQETIPVPNDSIPVDNSVNNIELSVDNNIFNNEQNIDIPDNQETTPIQDNNIQPTIPVDNLVNNTEQIVDNNINTSIQETIPVPNDNIPVDNPVNNIEPSIDNDIINDEQLVQNSNVQPTIPVDNTVNSTEQVVDNNIYPNNQETTPVQDNNIQPTIPVDNTVNSTEQAVDNIINTSTQETIPVPNDNIPVDNLVNNVEPSIDNNILNNEQLEQDNIQPTIPVDNTINNTEQVVDNSIYPSSQEITPVQDNNIQPTIPVDNTVNSTEQAVDNIINTSTQETIPVPNDNIPVDNLVNNVEPSIDNNIYPSNQETTSVQDNNIQPTIPVDNLVNNTEQVVDNNIYPSNQETTPVQDDNVQTTNTLDNNISYTEQSVDNNINSIGENADNTIQSNNTVNNDGSVTLGTVEVKGSKELDMEKKANKKKQTKKIVNIIIMSIVGIVILIAIIGLTLFLINRNKNKTDRIALVVDEFVEKSNLNDINNMISFINSYLHGNLAEAANYIHSDYNFRVNINSTLEAFQDLSNYNYTYTLIPRDAYNQYRITVGVDNATDYLLDIVGASNNNNDYYRFRGIEDDNEYVRTSDDTTGFKLQFPDTLGEINLSDNYTNALNKIKEIFNQKEFSTTEEEININEESHKVYKDTIIFTKDDVTNILNEATKGIINLDTNLIYELKLDFYTDRSDNTPLKIDITYNQNLITILLINNEYRVINYDDTNSSTINVNSGTTNIIFSQESENNYTFSITYTHNENEFTARIVANVNGEDLILDFVGKKDNIAEISQFSFTDAKSITEFNNANFTLNLLPTPFYKSMYQYNS